MRVSGSVFVELDGIKILISELVGTDVRTPWGSDNARSNLIVNLGSGMRAFEANTHDCLYLGGPTAGEYTLVPPGAEFAGWYGRGPLAFIEISPPPGWPAPAGPDLAAFDLTIFEEASAIAARVRAGRFRAVGEDIALLWHRALARRASAPLRRGAELSSEAFRTAQRIIHAAPSEIRTSAELAERTGSRLDGLNRTFVSRFGMTAARYMEETKLRQARRAVSSTMRPLADIAFTCGFASQAHMTDRMRTRLGTSPGRLRRLLAPHHRPVPPAA